MNKPEDYYSITEAVKILEMSPSYVNTLVELNYIAKRLIGKLHYGYLRADVDKFRAEHPGFKVHPNSGSFIQLLVQYERGGKSVFNIRNKKMMIRRYKRKQQL